MVDRIFTASKESFRLPSKKLIVVGHGIDIEKFTPGQKKENGSFTVLSVSRIAEAKNQMVMLEAFKQLKDQGFNGVLHIVGGPVTEGDMVYEKQLHEFVLQNNLSKMVNFIGPISPADVVLYYQNSDIFLNLSSTGSVDKAVLEAMACGVIPVTSNEAFEALLLPYGLYVKETNAHVIASKIKMVKDQIDSGYSISAELHDIIEKKFNLKQLIEVIVSQ